MDKLLPELSNCPFCNCVMMMEVDGDGHDYEYGDTGWETVTISGRHETDLFDCPFSQTDCNGVMYDLANFKSLQEVADIWNRRMPRGKVDIEDIQGMIDDILSPVFNTKLCVADARKLAQKAANNLSDRLNYEFANRLKTK